MRNQSSVQAGCAEYEGLLNEPQVALTSWATERAEISDRRGRGIYHELRLLQGNFLKAWALLQDHKRDCEMCQVILTMEPLRLMKTRFNVRSITDKSGSIGAKTWSLP